jgi:hypothetical protein
MQCKALKFKKYYFLNRYQANVIDYSVVIRLSLFRNTFSQAEKYISKCIVY